MSTDQIHSCSYYCHHPKCIERQRDELRDKFFEQAEKQEPWDTSDMAYRPNGLSMEQVREEEKLKGLVNDLFTKYLDVQEESDSGRMFHPISISCCRAMKLKPLGELLERLRELSK
jgi:hypothetical protein